MKETKHTPGPWTSRTNAESRRPVIRIIGTTPDEPIIAQVSTGANNPNGGDNALRIVACVNACEGIDPEAIPDLVEALETIRDWLRDPMSALGRDRFLIATVGSAALAKAKGE
jgi:hypothetical protein